MLNKFFQNAPLNLSLIGSRFPCWQFAIPERVQICGMLSVQALALDRPGSAPLSVKWGL